MASERALAFNLRSRSDPLGPLGPLGRERSMVMAGDARPRHRDAIGRRRQPTSQQTACAHRRHTSCYGCAVMQPLRPHRGMANGSVAVVRTAIGLIGGPLCTLLGLFLAISCADSPAAAPGDPGPLQLQVADGSGLCLVADTGRDVRLLPCHDGAGPGTSLWRFKPAGGTDNMFEIVPAEPTKARGPESCWDLSSGQLQLSSPCRGDDGQRFALSRGEGESEIRSAALLLSSQLPGASTPSCLYAPTSDRIGAASCGADSLRFKAGAPCDKSLGIGEPPPRRRILSSESCGGVGERACNHTPWYCYYTGPLGLLATNLGYCPWYSCSATLERTEDNTCVCPNGWHGAPDATECSATPLLTRLLSEDKRFVASQNCGHPELDDRKRDAMTITPENQTRATSLFETLSHVRETLRHLGISSLDRKFLNVCIDPTLRAGRNYYNPASGEIHVGGLPREGEYDQLLHELGHWLMWRIPNLGSQLKRTDCGAVGNDFPAPNEACALIEGFGDYGATLFKDSCRVLQQDYCAPTTVDGPLYKGNVAAYLYGVTRTAGVHFETVARALPSAASIVDVHRTLCELVTDRTTRIRLKAVAQATRIGATSCP
jgi:hypothetical protein